MKKIIILISCCLPVCSCLAQNNSTQPTPTMVKMIKRMVNDIHKRLSQPTESDRLVRGACVFIPPNGPTDTAMQGKIVRYFRDSVKMRFDNASKIIDDKEIPTPNLKLKCRYSSLPGYFDCSAFVEALSVKNDQENECLMPAKKMEQMIEQGILDRDERGYRDHSELEQCVYLSAHKEGTKSYTLTGKATVTYPLAYSSIVFSKGDTGITREINGKKIKLISMRNGVAVFKFSKPDAASNGAIASADDLQRLFLNKDGLPFNGWESTAIADYVYSEARKFSFDLTDQQVNDLAARFRFDENGKYESFSVMSVSGTLDKVVFYSVTKTGTSTVPVSITYKFKAAN